MIGVPARAQAALPMGRWAPNIGFYPPGMVSSPVAQLLAPAPAPMPLPIAPIQVTPPAPPPVTMASPAQGMHIGSQSDADGSSGPQPSVPSPNQDLASVLDAVMTGVGMVLSGPVGMLGAIPAMAALSHRENPQPTLGLFGAIGQLMGYPTIGQMVQSALGGGGGGNNPNTLSPDKVAAAFAMNDPWGTYDFATDTWGGGNRPGTLSPGQVAAAFAMNDPWGTYDSATGTWGGGQSSPDFSGIASTAGSLAGSSFDSMGNPII